MGAALVYVGHLINLICRASLVHLSIFMGNGLRKYLLSTNLLRFFLGYLSDIFFFLLLQEENVREWLQEMMTEGEDYVEYLTREAATTKQKYLAERYLETLRLHKEW